MGNDSKGLRQIEDFYSLSQSGTSRKKIVCTKKVYEIDHVEICLVNFLNFFDHQLKQSWQDFYVVGEKQLHKA